MNGQSIAQASRPKCLRVRRVSSYPFVKLRPNLILRRRPMHVSVVYDASRQSSGAYIPVLYTLSFVSPDTHTLASRAETPRGIDGLLGGDGGAL